MTSWQSLCTDLETADATWEDEAVVVDGKPVASREPDDLSDFCRELVKLFRAEQTQRAS
jgi:protease I